MSDAFWPVWNRAPLIEGYRWYINDPTIRSETEDGITLARPGCGAMVHYGEFTLRRLTSAERLLLDIFQESTVKVGGLPFLFYETVQGRWFRVRLLKAMQFDLEPDRVRWRTDVALREDPA